MVTDIPVLLIEGETIAEAWEKAVIAVWKNGVTIATEYNEMSKDATVTMIVKNPLQEPRIHPGSLARLYINEYVKEVLEGSKDRYVEEGLWPYTYHERLFNYRFKEKVYDQIHDCVIPLLKKAGYSRRAQAVTWQVWKDIKGEFPPCLQRVWCRVVNERLVMETSWRSRDLFKAADANMYAMTELQKLIAHELGVKIGTYIDFSNSLHIYEKDFPQVEHFLNVLKRRKNRSEFT